MVSAVVVVTSADFFEMSADFEIISCFFSLSADYNLSNLVIS
jgi:hypothetical protein